MRNHHVEFAGIFGSFARGQENEHSDIDFVVRYSEVPGLFGHIGLAHALEDVLQKRVDLATENSVKKSIISSVKQDLRILYGHVQRPDLR